jgi:hypothetical protein
VFAKPVVKTKGTNFVEFKAVQQIDGPWMVQFDKDWLYPVDGLSGKQAQGTFVFDKLVDWRQRPEAAVKYFAGTAKYSAKFTVKKNVSPGERYALNLGLVNVAASVRLNEVDLGVVWCEPWSIDVSIALRKGSNKLEIEVVNQWPNRLIGDGTLPEGQGLTRTNIESYYHPPGKGEHQLLPSGLIGPVVLLKEINPEL